MTATAAPEEGPTFNIWYRKSHRDLWRIAAIVETDGENTEQMFDQILGPSRDLANVNWLVLETTKPNPNLKRPS